MGSIRGVVLAGVLLSSTAEADVSKAWQAARDHLPSTTQMVLVVDAAPIAKLPSFARAFEAIRGQEKDLEMGYTLLKGACNVTDPVSWLDGLVMAGDTRTEQAVGFVQLTIDRTKASACLESVLKVVAGKQTVSVKQDGIYTVVTVGKEVAYFAWVAPNVVAFSIKPDNKASLDAFLNQKTWARSPAAALVAKWDPKAAVSGAFAVEKVDNWFPVSTAWGNLVINGALLTGTAAATFADAKTAKGFATEITEKRDRDVKKDKTPPAAKRFWNAWKIAAAGTEVTVKGSLTEKELGDAILASIEKTKRTAETSVEMKQILREMDEFSKKMCACKDKPCADRVNDEMTKWGTELAKRASAKSEKPDPETAKKAADSMTRYTECMTKLMMGN